MKTAISVAVRSLGAAACAGAASLMADSVPAQNLFAVNQISGSVTEITLGKVKAPLLPD